MESQLRREVLSSRQAPVDPQDAVTRVIWISAALAGALGFLLRVLEMSR